VIGFAMPLPTGQIQIQSANGSFEGVITPEPQGAEGLWKGKLKQILKGATYPDAAHGSH